MRESIFSSLIILVFTIIPLFADIQENNNYTGSEPDAYGYSWIDSDNPMGPTYHWEDIKYMHTYITNIDEFDKEVVLSIYMDFDFNYYGNKYNKCYVHKSGMISFDSTPGKYDNQVIPKDDGCNNVIAWLWTNLSPLTGSKIFYKRWNDCLIIQFMDFTIFDNNGIVNAQVILYKSGKILIQFKDFSGGGYSGPYTIGIENSDGTIGTQVAYNDPLYLHDELAIEFSLGGPYEPVANAGPDQEHDLIEQITLDGSASYDRDPNDVLVYEWTQTLGAVVILNDPNSSQPTFMPPTKGEYRFELTVSDGTLSSYNDEVIVMVCNNRPIAKTEPDKALQIPNYIVLDGTGSYDPDSEDELTYKWTQISGPRVVLEDTNSIKAGFYCDEKDIYTFQLVVNDGYSDSEPVFIKVTTVEVVMNQRLMNIRHDLVDNEGDPAYSHYPDVCGDKLAYGLGPVCDYSWDIDIEYLETCDFYEFYSTCPQSVDTYDIDTQPKIDGDIVVWFGGPLYDRPWGHEPSNFSVFMRRISTKEFVTLREYTMSKSYSHPAISGNKVVWLEHLNLDPTPTGSDEAENWWDTSYNICGADISNWNEIEYFTIRNNVGTRDPYPCHTYSSEFDDVIEICGNIVVYESDGDIYGADITDIDDIKVFTICSDPARQYDPSVYDNFVVWTDMRNDEGDIYGADISDINNIKEYSLIQTPGFQNQPELDEYIMVYVDGDSYGGNIKASCITRQYCAIDIPLIGSLYGTGPATDGKTIVWQTSSYGHLVAIALDFSYSNVNGPVRNAYTKKRYDYIQQAINDSNEGDTIIVEPGIYCEKINTKGKNIQIRSTKPDDSKIIESTILTSYSQDAVVTFADGQDVNCILNGLTITGPGTGIYCENFSSFEISNCNIINNKIDGISLYEGCEPVISDCLIMNNGNCGIKMYEVNRRYKNYNIPIITNSIISWNGSYGIIKGKPVIINSTIANNYECGMYNSAAIVANSIIYFNGDSSLEQQVTGDKTTITYSDIQGMWPGIGNIDSDPLFADSANGDYHLKSEAGRWDPASMTWVQDSSSSPCIDAGDPLNTVGPEPSPNGLLINMGAYGGTRQASMSQ